MASDPLVAAQQRACLAHLGATAEPEWLVRHRHRSLRQFAESGLPRRTDEAWRFTDLRPLIDGGLPLPGKDDADDAAQVAAHRLPGAAHRIVLVRGRFVPELSQIGGLPPGAWLGSLADAIDTRPDLVETALASDDAPATRGLAALNEALCRGGFVLALEQGVALEHPVEVLHYADAPDPRAYHLRSAILAGAGSQASVVETYVGTGRGWTNAVTTVDVGDGAVLRHVKVQAESTEANHTALLRARLETESRYESFLLTTGARLSRHDLHVVMTGDAPTLIVNAAYLLSGEQEATIAPFVDHHRPGGQTKELLKGVIGGRAHGVFLGSVTVREGADSTDARQLNRNLMLSRTARIDTKPELLIYADEVKCGHGATVGDLDEAALFYLISRGIDSATARRILVEAFAAEIFDVADLAPDIDAHARRYLHAWLDREGCSA